MVAIQSYNKKSRLKQEEITEIQHSLLSYDALDLSSRDSLYKKLAEKYNCWPKTIESIDNGKYMNRYRKKEVKNVVVDLSEMKQKLIDAAQKIIENTEKEVKAIDEKISKLNAEKVTIKDTPQYKEAFQLLRSIERSNLGLDKN